MRLLLALPTAGNPAAPFLESLRSLELPGATTAFDRLTVTGNFIPGQREVAARRAVAQGADVLMMLDDDMIVPPDALARLTEVLAGDQAYAIAGALYYSRDGLRPMAASRWTSHDTTAASIPAFDDGITAVDAVGFGCVAVRVSVLKALAPPYFSTQVFLEESAARVRICNEDYLLCERMRAAGFHVALHAGVRCKHFDRQSQTAHPLEWEPAAETARERMLVADPGPHYRLIPYDAAGARAGEHHETAALDYLSVE
ncbi:MAG: glycosyltransferase family 2 protein [Candidatus Velthaea sp.]